MKIEKISVQEYNVHQINSIKKKYPELRQNSKGLTFALTYAGTWHTLMKKFGLPKEQAIQVEQRYHELYKHYEEFIANQLREAQTTGYITGAFGLRVRTPLLKSCIMGTKNTLKEAEAEKRTAGNALGQSWCLLNNRSANEVMQEVWNSPYKYDVLPAAQIHDALYFFVKDNLETLTWFNKVLIKAMEWQEHPAIKHDKLKLGGDLEVHFPSWGENIEIPNYATKEEVKNALRNQ